MDLSIPPPPVRYWCVSHTAEGELWSALQWQADCLTASGCFSLYMSLTVCLYPIQRLVFSLPVYHVTSVFVCEPVCVITARSHSTTATRTQTLSSTYTESHTCSHTTHLYLEEDKCYIKAGKHELNRFVFEQSFVNKQDLKSSFQTLQFICKSTGCNL